MPRIAIYFRMFSPYILARINAAATVAKVVGIEGSRRSTTYAWEPSLGAQQFERVTLFEDRAVETVPNADVIAAVDAALTQANPDIVVAGGWSHVEALAMIAWARKRRKQVIMMSESNSHDAARSWPRELLKKRIVNMADAALVGGKSQAEYIAQLGMPLSNVFIGYDAVDNDFFLREAEKARANPALREELGLPGRYFLASARFIEKKNFHRMIRAFSAYRANHGEGAWDLVIVGDGPLRGELEALVARLDLSDYVHFPGFKQYDELPAFYALAGAFLHFSTSEQWGLVVNEAMASGLPVIVSAQTGCSPELVHDGVNGWTIDASSEEQMIARMGDMMTADRESFAQASRDIVGEYGPARFAGGLKSAIGAAQAMPARGLSIAGRLVLRAASFRDTSPG